MASAFQLILEAEDDNDRLRLKKPRVFRDSYAYLLCYFVKNMTCPSWLIFTTLLLGTQGLTRSRRSVSQFSSMVRALTVLTLSDVNGYGNFCGFRGSGNPVDNVDRCCQIHDNCLKVANRKSCTPLFYLSFFMVPYAWQHIVHQRLSTVVCSSSNSRCQRALCECDKKAAECFALFDHEYNPTYKRSKRLYIF